MPEAPVRQAAVAAIRAAHDDIVLAARHLDPGRTTWSPGGAARHAVAILAHCGADCLFHASVIAGEPIPYRTSEEREQAVATCATLDDAIEFLRQGVERVCHAIEGLTPQRFQDRMTMPWGQRVPVLQGILAPAAHLNYHSGQINQIQAILGDDEHH